MKHFTRLLAVVLTLIFVVIGSIGSASAISYSFVETPLTDGWFHYDFTFSADGGPAIYEIDIDWLNESIQCSNVTSPNEYWYAIDIPGSILFATYTEGQEIANSLGPFSVDFLFGTQPLTANPNTLIFSYLTVSGAVPEPSTIILLASGLVGLAGYRIKKGIKK